MTATSARAPTRAAIRWRSAPPGGWPTAGESLSRWKRPQLRMLAERGNACLLHPVQPYTLVHAIQRYTLSRVHPLALAAGRCRTTGGRAATTWRTWRSGRSCWPTCGGRRLLNRSCCAGGSTRGDR
eukprot:scaffold68867_cov63-Phaeocystis_antarctica.AAC.1